MQVLLSWMSQKISAIKNLARVAADEQNSLGFREFARESGSDSMNKWVMWSSPHQYILYKQPTFYYQRQLSDFQRRPRKP